MSLSLQNDLLEQKTSFFDFDNPSEDPVELAHKLVKTMLDLKGVGLAANQVGLPYRAFVCKSDPMIVAFNPKIVDYLGEMIYLEEGCLSFPGLIVKVKRHEGIRIRFTMPNGETITKEYHGITARIMQHEIDHLDGKLFYNRANRIHRERGFRQWKKRQKSTS